MVTAAAIEPASAKTKGKGRIPETQAEAAAKEAEVDGATKPHSITVKIPKSCGFDAEILIGKRKDWWWSGKFYSPIAGKSKVIPAGAPYASEADATAAAFTELGSWLEAHKLIGTKVAAKVREVLAAVDAHQARILGKPAGEASPAKPAVPLAERVNSAPQRSIELSKIDPSPENMRKDFDAAALKELADSIATHGLGQPILVYAVGERFEIIAGDRRHRAGKLAKVKELPCRVVDCDAGEAAELRLIENLKRRDLSAIEEALGYQTLLKDGRYTQEQLGKQIGVSQPTIANRLRLLRLPADWQSKIIQREITESHARELVDLAERPTALAHLAAVLKATVKRDGEPPSLRNWKEWIARALREISRPCYPGRWFNFQKGKEYRQGSVLLTEKDFETHADELQIVTIKDSGQTYRLALNVDRWDELQEAAEKVERARQEKRDAKAAGAKGTGGETSAASEARKRKEQAEQLERKVAGYCHRWLQRTAAVRSETMTDDQLMRLLIAFCCQSGSRERESDLFEALKSHGGKKLDSQRHGYGWGNPMQSVMTVQGKELLPVAREIVTAWLRHCIEGPKSTLETDDLQALVELFSINIGKEWRLDEEFLLLHTKDQLAALRKEWGLTGDVPEKRGEIIAAILADDKKKRLPAPKALLKGRAK